MIIAISNAATETQVPATKVASEGKNIASDIQKTLSGGESSWDSTGQLYSKKLYSWLTIVLSRR